MSVLATENLVSGYGTMVIVNDVTVKVPPKQIVLLIGANGSGKSTLVKSTVGLASLFGGHVYLKGEDISKIETFKRIKKGIGYVPQGGNTFLGLSVRTNFELGSYAASTEVDVEERIEEMVRIFPNLSNRLESKVRVLSGGMRQMVALGRAMMANPSVLILDEPTAGMAPMAVKGLLSKIAELRDAGTTILLVEQNVKTAVLFADYVYLMSQGKVTAEFTGAEVAKVDIGDMMLKSMTLRE
jgi:branched-chain amino acid transport system ATP-binding protein